jgi:DNA invertase Pin-like site-specific DNA recombinase
MRQSSSGAETTINRLFQQPASRTVGRDRHQHGATDDCVLGGLPGVECDLIRTRTAEGRSRAQKRGQHMDRSPKLTAAQRADARRPRAEGATLAELARSYGVGKSTIWRLST